MLNHISFPNKSAVISPALNLTRNEENNSSLSDQMAIVNYGKINNLGYDDLLDRAGVGFWRFDFSQNTLELCPVSCRMTKLHNKSSLRKVLSVIHPHGAKEFLGNICMLARTGNGFEEEAHIIMEDGNSKWFRISGILEQNNDGFANLSGAIIDVTAFKLEEIRRADAIACMFHEVKTPITTLRLYVQSSLRNMQSTARKEVTMQLEKADHQISVVDGIVNTYVNVALTKNGTLHLHPTRFDLSELIYELIQNHSMAYPDQVIKYALGMPEFVYADREKIAQVINNMLSNALKFSPPYSFVHVNCEHSLKGTLFSVTDQGAGIAKSDQKKLFSKYFRVENNRTGSVKGHGLGLYLSKQIVEAHRGVVFVKSEVGMGSVFGFFLPDSAPQN